AVEALGALDVGHRDDDDLELHVGRAGFRGLDHRFAALDGTRCHDHSPPWNHRDRLRLPRAFRITNRSAGTKSTSMRSCCSSCRTLFSAFGVCTIPGDRLRAASLDASEVPYRTMLSDARARARSSSSQLRRNPVSRNRSSSFRKYSGSMSSTLQTYSNESTASPSALSPM